MSHAIVVSMVWSWLSGCTPPPLEVACAPSPDNPLRGRCTVSGAVGPIALHLTDGAEEVTFRVDAGPDVPVWGLPADSTWDVSATVGGATLSTEWAVGSLPPALASLSIDGDVPGSSIAELLVPASCGENGYLAAFDARGRIRWYQGLAWAGAPREVGIGGFRFGEGQVLAVVGREQLVRTDWLADPVHRIVPDRPVHHDVVRRGGWSYVLEAEVAPGSDGAPWVQDVVAAYDDHGVRVFEWAERDVLDPATAPDPEPSTFWDPVFPGAADAWHTNGLDVLDDGSLVLTMEQLDAVVTVVDGAIGRVLIGTPPGDPLRSDYALIEADGGDPTFARPHHPALYPDGRLTLFDDHHARGLELSLDHERHIAFFSREWAMEGPCNLQGSVFDAPDGHVVTACPTTRSIAEFDADGALLGTRRLTCREGQPPATLRAQPVDLWTGATGGVAVSRE